MTDLAGPEPSPRRSPARTGTAFPAPRPRGQKPSGSLAVSGYPSVDDVRYRRGDNAVLRSALIEQWNARCYWCEEPTRFTDTQIDHIIPHTVTPDELHDLVQLHGLSPNFDLHAPANLAPICGTCNRKKADRKLRAPVVTMQLDRAREKQARVINYVRAAVRARKGWSEAVTADLQLTTDADVLARMRLLTERAQSLSEVWQIEFSTGPDDAAVRYTPKPDAAVTTDGVGLPPLFDLPTTDDAAAQIAHQLADVRDYGGDVIVPARYLRASPDSNRPSLAEALGPLDPDDELVLTAGLTPIDPSGTYQLVLVTAAGSLRQSLALHPQRVTVGQRGHRVTLRDASGVFGVFVQIEHPPHGTTVTAQLISQSLTGRYPYRLRELRTFFQLAEPTDQLEIRLNDQPIGRDTDDPIELGPVLMAFRHDTAVIAALDHVQAHSRQRFTIPDQITAEERGDLLLAAQLLVGERIQIPGPSLTIILEPEAIEAFLQKAHDTLGEFGVEGPRYVVHCGPHQMTLGRVTVLAPAARLTNLDEVRAASGAGTSVKAHYQIPNETGYFLQLLPHDYPAG